MPNQDDGALLSVLYGTFLACSMEYWSIEGRYALSINVNLLFPSVRGVQTNAPLSFLTTYVDLVLLNIRCTNHRFYVLEFHPELITVDVL